MHTSLLTNPTGRSDAGAAAPAPTPERLLSLDAYRGAIILLMASSGLGLPQVAAHFPDSALWRWLGAQCEHAPWAGCTVWDLIQPAFMFMVGVALPWSLANRRARGQHFGSLFAHALWRSVLLVLLAVFLTSAWSRRTEWFFTNVLGQIGLGYPFLFLIAFTPTRARWAIASGILAACWLAFALHPLPPPEFDWAAVGVPADWPHLNGFVAHWEKNFNAAASFDRWFLNLFPREHPFLYSTGGYQTLNFIPSLVTMILGVQAGELLRSQATLADKMKRLAVAGALGVAVGQALALAGVCPIVKRIWTPSWVLFSGGWVTLLLAGFVLAVDGLRWTRAAFPLVVAGMNPITLYCLWQLTPGFISGSLKTHLGQAVFAVFGSNYAPIAERLSVLLVLWLIVLWMHRRRLYLRL